MTKTELEKVLEDLEKTKIELQNIYPQHVLTLTEAGAGDYALEKLELEHELLNIKINRAIENTKFMLSRA